MRTQATEAQLTILNTESGDFDYPLVNTSLTYLKSENHPGIFCLITQDLTTEEINFLKAVKIFKADQNEKPLELHGKHHEQALAAMEFFKTEKNQENIQTVSRKNLSPAENKAITNINAIVRIAPTEQKRKVLQRTLEVIKQGTFASKGFPKEINDFFINNERVMHTPETFIELLFSQVLDRYDLSTRATEHTIQQPKPRGIINPKIVLTQSFS